MRRSGLLFSSVLSFVSTVALAEPGSITSVRRDVVVSEALPGRVVAVLSDVRVAARVSGAVIVWGGSVSFAPGGSVAGDLLVVGGTIEAPPGHAAPVEGRVSTPGSLLHLYLSEMRRAPWEENAFGSSVLSGLHLLALSAWLAVALALLWFSLRRLRARPCSPKRTGRARCSRVPSAS
jgi:hypothetical protein